MSYKLYSDEEKRLQRKLIPLNIVVAIVALVAAISLLITPLLKINFGKAVSSYDFGEDSGFDEYIFLVDDIDAELEIAPLGMAKVLFAPADQKGVVFMDELLLKNNVFETMLVSFVNTALVLATEEVEASELGEIDFSVLREALLKVDSAKSSDDVLKVLDGYLSVLEQQIDTTLTEDMKEAARENTLEIYDKTVAATGGSFSVEEMFCVNFSPEGKAYTSYSEFIMGMLKGDFADSEEMRSLAEIAETVNSVATYYGYAFIYVAFHVLMWVILFLFAFFRMFAKNKRFTMWYVKLVSCWPCIIFWCLLSFGLSKLATMISVIAPFAGLFAAFSSFTWISGICYLLIWALSIFWAFPIKHKIRKIRKGR
ncbi:MAG: hypothetical protein K2O89_04715 [Clostridia bacterium]|nr:hypothetical protein [Clostridia bacterium]